MLASQSSRTSLSINTTFNTDTIRRKSVQLNHSDSSSMSHEELTSKIADSFQEFSNMLSQLSSCKNKSPATLSSSLPEIKNKESPLIQQTFSSVKPLSPPITLRDDTFENSKEDKSSDSSEEEDPNNIKKANMLLLKDINMENTRLYSIAECLILFICKGRKASLQKMIDLGVDLNCTDNKELGITPLMYAAYFGKLDCLWLLLQQPSIQVNKQDKKGWTALMWSMSGCQVEAVRLLLEYGSEKSIITRSGRRLSQYSTCDTIQKIIDTPTSNQVEKDYVKMESNQTRSKDTLNSFPSKIAERPTTRFNWNHCLPDQMFVFSYGQVPFIIDQIFSITSDTIRSLKCQHELSSELWAPANIIFLCARFAHYYCNRELLNLLLDTFIIKLQKAIKSTSRDLHILSFWIANSCQLVNYLKKDAELSVVTSDSQETLSLSITEAYTFVVIETQKKLEKILMPSLMEYDSIHGDDDNNPVQFVDDWRFFFTKNSQTSSMNPQIVTDLLEETQQIMESYHVPAAVIIQAIAQFFYYLACELFNRMLSQRKYLCRSKALQIRLNLSVIEEWVKAERLPSSLNHAFEPVSQLLQLLQCLSQLDDMAIFTSTINTFDRLNPLQIIKCVQQYRYEVSEPKLPDHIKSLALQMMTLKKTQSRRSLNDSKRLSASSLNSLLTPKNKRMSTPERLKAEEEEREEGEKKDSKYLLPFSVFSTNVLLQDWADKRRSINQNDIIYQEIKLKKLEEYDLLDKIIPSIPDEWLYQLDRKLKKN
ncbi:hypothetical protein G6F22_007580 [Rhizopus arrhizus]|nr:hypothetical protein G6F23_001845 [Rhizopus arrhizus]KAG0786592.1 hypothetical protein G6F22_007580 [Rhizopus arrhizus]